MATRIRPALDRRDWTSLGGMSVFVLLLLVELGQLQIEALERVLVLGREDIAPQLKIGRAHV